MYSKFHPNARPVSHAPRGGTAPSGQAGGGWGSIQGPSYRQRVRVPPGYRGLAIVDGEERLSGGVLSDRVASEGDRPPVLPLAGGTLPENRDFGLDIPDPRLASLEEGRGGDLPAPRFYQERLSEGGEADELAGEEPPAHSVPSDKSAPAGLFGLSRFPFGHGIGTEEWLLIGLIFLLLHEAGDGGGPDHDRGDLYETLVLLGLLLVGG